MGWAGLLALATLGGFAIAVYVMRPLLIPSFQETGTFSPEQAALNVTNSGQLSMHDVEYSCGTNKVVFANTHTLNPSRFVLLFTQRTIPDVKPGEQFRIDCIQAWHLYVSDNKANGILEFGDYNPADPKVGEQFIWAFNILSDNSIQLTHNPHPGDHLVLNPPDKQNVGLPISGVDMTATVSYSLFFGNWRFSKHFRYITRTDFRNSLVWALVPANYPPIPDGTGGLYLTLNGGPMTVTLNSK